MSVLTNRIVNFVQESASKAGITLLRNSRYSQEWQINAALLAEAAEAERTGRSLKARAATGIVFSFNRPVQLHLLLTSYFELVKNPAQLVVQYGAKGEDFEQAYRDVAKAFPQVEFVRERGFRDTLLGVLGAVKTASVFFLVDDIVFTRETDMKEYGALDPREVVPALRLAPTLSYCYTVGVNQPAPSFRPYAERKEMLEFTWGEQGNEWNYPMSVDGNLFDTGEITVMSRVTQYKAPNTYEGALMRFAPVFRRRQGVCHALPKIMNIPCNKVQSEVENRAGDITPEYLLQKWQKGEVIDPRPFRDYPNKGPHEDVPFVFKKGQAAGKKGKAA